MRRSSAFDPGRAPRPAPAGASLQRQLGDEWEIIEKFYKAGDIAGAVTSVGATVRPHTGIDVFISPPVLSAAGALQVKVFAINGNTKTLVDAGFVMGNIGAGFDWVVACRVQAERYEVTVTLTDNPPTNLSDDVVVTVIAGPMVGPSPSDVGVKRYKEGASSPIRTEANKLTFGGLLSDVRVAGVDVTNTTAAVRWFRIYEGAVANANLREAFLVPAGQTLFWRNPGGIAFDARITNNSPRFLITTDAPPAATQAVDGDCIYTPYLR